MRFYPFITTTGEQVIINLEHIVMLTPDVLGTRIKLVTEEEVYVRNEISCSFGSLDIGFAK